MLTAKNRCADARGIRMSCIGKFHWSNMHSWGKINELPTQAKPFKHRRNRP
jgi:hypothetical protein